MKNVILTLCILGLVSTFTQAQKPKKEKNKCKKECCAMKDEKLLRHVVMFKFKDGTSDEDIKKIEEAFKALPSKIKEIYAFEWGTNNSPESHAQGLTHCFLLTFKSEADRAVYLPHPAHKEFGKILGPHLDKVVVVDYWTEK